MIPHQIILIILGFCLCFGQALCDGATKCYFCNGACEDPLQTINCNNLKGNTYGCITAHGILGIRSVDFRGCVVLQNTEDVENCNRLDKRTTGKCSICNTTLCNSGVVGAGWIELIGLLFSLIVLM